MIDTTQEQQTMVSEHSGKRSRAKASDVEWVMFPSTEGIGGADDVKIGHNCVVNVYKRDVPVAVPKHYLEVVDNGVVTMKLDDGQMVTKKRFPYVPAQPPVGAA